MSDAESFHSMTPDGSGTQTTTSGSFPSSPFFADAMLDLDTAHDLAETPDASQFQRRTVDALRIAGTTDDALLLPSSSSTDMTTTTSTSTTLNHHHDENDATRRRAHQGEGGNVPSSTTTTSSSPPPTPTGTTMHVSSATFLDTPVMAKSNHNNTPEKQEMTRITHLDSNAAAESSSLRRMRLLWSSLPKSRPTWPRDWAWALAFCIVVPLALAGPLVLAQTKQLVWTQPPLSNATLGAWWVSAAAAAVTTRWMYGRKWRQEDRSTRHERVAAGLVAFAAMSVVLYLVLAVTIFVRLPNARWAAILPLGYTFRDVYLVRRWKQRRSAIMTSLSSSGNSSGRGRNHRHQQQQQQPTSPSSSSSSYASRYAFFQALVSMALDILAQSLRRASFFRVLTLILITQTFVIWLWRQALIAALDDESVWLLVLAAVGGKWATGTLARLLSLIASGGVVNWFVQQQEQYPEDDTNNIHPSENDDEEYYNGDVEMYASQVPEAYRTVGASVYQSVLKMVNVLDDDDDDDYDDEFYDEGNREATGQDFYPDTQQDNAHHRHSPPQESLSTVRGLLSAGLSVSFGSVAMCGLLGGPAQFVWSQIRKVNLLQQQGYEAHANSSVVEKTWNQVLLWARSFVRSHSDLAMSHVAAYYKPYPRAARDVAQLIEEAGGMSRERICVCYFYFEFFDRKRLTSSN